MQLDGGEELAKVLYYYGLIDNADSNTDKVRCPFHADDNPSMAISYEKGIATCYVCDVTLNAFKFVKFIEERDNNNFDELLQLRKYARILKSDEVSKLNYIKKKKITVREQIAQLNKSKHYYYGVNEINWVRDKSEEVLRCKAYMKPRGFKASTLKRFGAKVTYNRSYPIMFPIMDNGKYKGHLCRTDLQSVEDYRKYLYNTGFSKKNTLAGEYGNTKICVLCEGYFDLMIAYQNGLKEYDICAIFGWKISEQQISKLKDSGVTSVVSMLDNDECGIKGTCELRKHFKVYRFKFLKSYKDVGEMNEETFMKCWTKTKDFYKLH